MPRTASRSRSRSRERDNVKMWFPRTAVKKSKVAAEAARDAANGAEVAKQATQIAVCHWNIDDAIRASDVATLAAQHSVMSAQQVDEVFTGIVDDTYDLQLQAVANTDSNIDTQLYIECIKAHEAIETVEIYAQRSANAAKLAERSARCAARLVTKAQQDQMTAIVADMQHTTRDAFSSSLYTAVTHRFYYADMDARDLLLRLTTLDDGASVAFHRPPTVGGIYRFLPTTQDTKELDARTLVASEVFKTDLHVNCVGYLTATPLLPNLVPVTKRMHGTGVLDRGSLLRLVHGVRNRAIQDAPHMSTAVLFLHLLSADKEYKRLHCECMQSQPSEALLRDDLVSMLLEYERWKVIHECLRGLRPLRPP